MFKFAFYLILAVAITMAGTAAYSLVITEVDRVAVIHLLSHVWLFVTPWTATGQASLSFTVSWSLLRFMSIESVMPSKHLILCCHLLLCLRSFPALGSFPMSHFFASGGQSIGLWVSASASGLPVNIQGWFPLWLTGLISLMSKGLSRVFSSILDSA